MATSKGKKAKAVECDEDKLNTVENFIGSKKLTSMIRDLIDEIFLELSAADCNDMLFEGTYRRKKIQYELLKEDLDSVEDKISLENERFERLTEDHEKKIEKYEVSKNEILKEFEYLKNSLRNDEKILRKNSMIKEDIIRKILLHYKNEILDLEVFKYELDSAEYRFSIEEFRSFSNDYLTHRKDSEICIASHKYLNDNNIKESEVSDEYKLVITEKIIEFIDSLCRRYVITFS